MAHRFYPAPPIGLMRRDRRCPEQYDNERTIVAYSPTHGAIYFDDLSIGSGKPPSPYNPRGFAIQRMTGRVPLKPVFFDSEHRQLRSRVAEPRRVGGKVPFGRAMRKLHKELEKAEAFYKGFYNDFDADIQSIKAFATQDIRADLWLLKAGRLPGDRKSSDSTEGNDDNDQEKSPEQLSQKFDGWEEKVNRAMQTAIDARIGESSSPNRKIETRLDSRRRLQRKVEVASEQIADLLQKAADDRDGCKALLSELDALKALIDPDDQKNSEMYKGVGDDEVDDDVDE